MRSRTRAVRFTKTVRTRELPSWYRRGGAKRRGGRSQTIAWTSFRPHRVYTAFGVVGRDSIRDQTSYPIQMCTPIVELKRTTTFGGFDESNEMDPDCTDRSLLRYSGTGGTTL